MYFFSFLKLLPTTFAACGQGKELFGFIPTWYKYLNFEDDCTPHVEKLSDILAIGLAVLDMLVRVAGFVAVIMIIYAGISYIMAAGNSEKAASARKKLYNALIGLAIAIIAAGFVAFIGNSLT